MTQTSTIEPPSSRPWYAAPVTAGVLLVLCFPIGLFLMWRYQHWSQLCRWSLMGTLASFVIINAVTSQPAVRSAVLASAVNVPETSSTRLTVEVPVSASSATNDSVPVHPVKAESSSKASSDYVAGNCKELQRQARRLSNFHPGDPNYTAARDRDGDGIACEG